MNNKVLDIYRPKNETLNDAFDRLVVTIHHQNRMYNHRTFVLTGCEPRVGTTTIAINVAISLAMSGLKTILIDGDLRKEGKYKRLSDRVEQGLSDVLRCNLDLASAICATNYDTLDYLPSGTQEENPVGLLYSPNLDKVIASLAGYYDYVIFDLPSANAAIDSNILASKVDAVVLVAKQHSTKTMQIKNAKKELDKIAANLVGIVFNNVNASEYRRYMKNYDYFNKGIFINSNKNKNEDVDDSNFELDYNDFKDDSNVMSQEGFELSREDINNQINVENSMNMEDVIENIQGEDIIDNIQSENVVDNINIENVVDDVEIIDDIDIDNVKNVEGIELEDIVENMENIQDSVIGN